MPLLLLTVFLLASCGEKASVQTGPLVATDPSRIAVAAQLVGKTRAPNPDTSPYVDCLMVYEFRVLENESDVRIPQHILAAVPAFLNRVLQPAVDFTLGQVCRLELPRDVKNKGDLGTLQLVDQIENLDLPLYYTRHIALDGREAADFPERPESYFTGTSAAIPAPARHVEVKYPWSERAATERKAAMQADLQTIQTLLAANGGTWEAWDEKLAPFHDDLRTKMEASPEGITKGPHFFRSLRNKEYRDVTADPTRGPVRMITTLHEELLERGIDLLVVPYPAKEMVNAHHFSDQAPKDGIYSPWRLKFTHELLQRGVEVLDLTQALQENKAGHEWLFYDAADLHPATGGIQIAAEEIAKRLARYDFSARKEWPGLKYKTVPSSMLARQNTLLGETRPGASYPVLQVVGQDGSLVPVEEQMPSPVIVMGDSFTLVPGPTVPSASIPAHLARHLGEVPAQLVSLGSSEKAMRMLAREGGAYLAGRAVIVFIFSPSRLLGAISSTGDGGWDLYHLPPLILK